VLLAPAGTLALALTGAHQPDPLVFPVVSWVLLSMVTIVLVASRRPSAGGRAVLDRWHAAALGRAPGATAIFAAPKKDVVWSSYRGTWQLLPVETHTWPWPRAVAVVLAIIVGPFVLVGGLPDPGTLAGDQAQERRSVRNNDFNQC
jgi:hypothetical protein